MKCKIAIISLYFASLLSFSVLANDIDGNEYNYVNEQKITISFDYGERTGIYSGGIKNGLPHGIGKFSSTNATGQDWEYIGEWETGHFNGIGTTIYSDGQVSIANYENDHMYGNGIIVYPDPALYVGEINDNGSNGDGTSLSISNRYVGEFENGLRNGKGILYFENGNRYEGEFVDQYINGSGIYYFPSGDRVEGTFWEDSETTSVNGNGTYYSTDNSSYPCTITDGQLSIEGLSSQSEISIETERNSYEPDESTTKSISGKDIFSFRDIPWWSSKSEAESLLISEGAKVWQAAFENNVLRMNGIDYMNSVAKSDRVDGGGIVARYSGINVAGYIPTDTQACYIYTLNEDGSINKNKDNAQFYFGWYTFDLDDYIDGDSVYDDLRQKLTSLYGEGIEDAERDHFNTITWYDSENNQIRLLLGGNETDYKYATLGYMAAGADERLDEMQIALDTEAAENEAAERESNKNNVSGL